MNRWTDCGSFTPSVSWKREERQRWVGEERLKRETSPIQTRSSFLSKPALSVTPVSPEVGFRGCVHIVLGLQTPPHSRSHPMGCLWLCSPAPCPIQWAPAAYGEGSVAVCFSSNREVEKGKDSKSLQRHIWECSFVQRCCDMWKAAELIFESIFLTPKGSAAILAKCTLVSQWLTLSRGRKGWDVTGLTTCRMPGAPLSSWSDHYQTLNHCSPHRSATWCLQASAKKDSEAGELPRSLLCPFLACSRLHFYDLTVECVTLGAVPQESQNRDTETAIGFQETELEVDDGPVTYERRDLSDNCLVANQIQNLKKPQTDQNRPHPLRKAKAPLLCNMYWKPWHSAHHSAFRHPLNEII